MKIRIGTSGYDYNPWKGRFYPATLPRSGRLGYYATHFDTCEINASFYKLPSAEMLQRMATQVPPDFRFSMKAWQRITHHRRLRGASDAVASFVDVAQTFGPRLAPILYQLPPNLPLDLPLLRDFLAALPRGLAAAFEFRHASWFSDETWALLRKANAALCVADTEDLETPLVRTAKFGYFRLRRDRYGPAALRKWAQRIQGAGFTKDVFVYFRHEDTAKGTKYAKRLAALVISQASADSP